MINLVVLVCRGLFSVSPTPTLTLMKLPAELIDHIFSFLQTDIPSLKACSKAHPLLSRLAERHIYAHIVIDPGAEVCNLILGNPRFLDYPRTLEICSHLPLTPHPVAIPIMQIIPQMANLISLKISPPYSFFHRMKIFSTLRNCLQQSSFHEFHLFRIYDLSSTMPKMSSI